MALELCASQYSGGNTAAGPKLLDGLLTPCRCEAVSRSEGSKPNFIVLFVLRIFSSDFADGNKEGFFIFGLVCIGETKLPASLRQNAGP